MSQVIEFPRQPPMTKGNGAREAVRQYLDTYMPASKDTDHFLLWMANEGYVFVKWGKE